jgi:copper chaperone
MNDLELEVYSIQNGFRLSQTINNRVMKTEIHVSGMRCAGCEMLVSEALEEMEGVDKAKASHQTGVVEVEYDQSKADIESMKKVIEGQGFRVTA